MTKSQLRIRKHSLELFDLVEKEVRRYLKRQDLSADDNYLIAEIIFLNSVAHLFVRKSLSDKGSLDFQVRVNRGFKRLCTLLGTAIEKQLEHYGRQIRST